jgi:NADH-quinone oxidoreductase subunit N
MIWGCFGALGEQLIKRFIAYSSINQMGFLFLNTREEKTYRSLTYLTDFNDYAQQNYLYSITFAIILFSMAGIPPLGGFFGKYYLFVHSFETGHIDLVVIGMFTSLISAYYYLRIIKIM